MISTSNNKLFAEAQHFSFLFFFFLNHKRLRIAHGITSERTGDEVYASLDESYFRDLFILKYFTRSTSILNRSDCKLAIKILQKVAISCIGAITSRFCISKVNITQPQSKNVPCS